MFGDDAVQPGDDDLTVGPGGEAVGQRIIVTGRLLDGGGRPIPSSLIEIWQANASGRYRHQGDQWPGALDPNFTGGGRTLTDADGTYRFTTIRPGAYPWGNHPNAWRPAHIHLSVFGRAFTQRLVTQMYFPDDPLFFQDPIFNAVPDPAARARLVARYDHDVTEAVVGARVPLRRRRARPGGDAVRGRRRWLSRPGLTPSQTVGPFLHLALADPALRHPVAADDPGAITVGGTVVDGAGARRPRRRDRDVAGRRAVRPLPDRTRRRLGRPHASSRRGVADARRHGPGPAPRRVGLRPRPARPARHAHLLRRRGGGQRRRPDARRRRSRPPAPARRRRSSGPGSTVSTSASKVPMSPSSSRSDAFGFLVARGPVAAATSGPAWLQAMLDAEAALAGAQADVGEIPGAAAEAIAAACRVDRFDVDAVLADAALGGNAVIPLVAGLRELVGAGARAVPSTSTPRARTSSTRRRRWSCGAAPSSSATGC